MPAAQGSARWGLRADPAAQGPARWGLRADACSAGFCPVGARVRRLRRRVLCGGGCCSARGGVVVRGRGGGGRPRSGAGVRAGEVRGVDAPAAAGAHPHPVPSPPCAATPTPVAEAAIGGSSAAPPKRWRAPHRHPRPRGGGRNPRQPRPRGGRRPQVVANCGHSCRLGRHGWARRHPAGARCADTPRPAPTSAPVVPAHWGQSGMGGAPGDGGTSRSRRSARSSVLAPVHRSARGRSTSSVYEASLSQVIHNPRLPRHPRITLA